MDILRLETLSNTAAIISLSFSLCSFSTDKFGARCTTQYFIVDTKKSISYQRKITFRTENVISVAGTTEMSPNMLILNDVWMMNGDVIWSKLYILAIAFETEYLLVLQLQY